MIMNSKNEITICLGSSCYSRGNDVTLEIIKDYLRENNLKESVFFKGHLCIELCNKGPVVKINDQTYTNVSKDNIISILDNHFKKTV